MKILFYIICAFLWFWVVVLGIFGCMVIDPIIFLFTGQTPISDRYNKFFRV